MGSIHIYAQPHEDYQQVLQRAKEEMVRDVAPDKPEAFVMMFQAEGYSPFRGISIYSGKVAIPLCTIQHEHNRCGLKVLGHRYVFIHWRPQPEE